MAPVSASYLASIAPKTRPSYIVLSDERLATLPADTQAQVRRAQEGIRRAREYAAKDHSNEVRVWSKPITNQTAEQKAEVYRPKNAAGVKFGSYKPTKFGSNEVILANVTTIPADQLDERISYISASIKKGAFKGMDFYSGNGDQPTKSPEEYLSWLKAAKASVVSFEKFA